MNFLKSIGTSSHPLARLIASGLRFPVHMVELRRLSYYKGPQIVSLLKQIRRERELGQWNDAAYMIYSCVQSARRLPGPLAEVGVYQGGSAKLICEAKGDQQLHLFDTFGGLPEPDAIDPYHTVHQFAVSLESVQRYLNAYPNVFFHKGLCPSETGQAVEHLRFAFAHLDVDFYRSTRECLEFFYPRMIPGGIIIVSDYTHLPGVKQATDEVLRDTPDTIIDLPTSQLLVIKSRTLG